MIHDFYNNTRKDTLEVESDVKNFDTKMQDLESSHRVEIKTYIQKVKHLEYEHGINCELVDNKAGDKMREERGEHNKNETDMRKGKKTEKEEYKTNDLNALGEVEEKEKELELGLTELRKQLDL